MTSRTSPFTVKTLCAQLGTDRDFPAIARIQMTTRRQPVTYRRRPRFEQLERRQMLSASQLFCSVNDSIVAEGEAAAANRWHNPRIDEDVNGFAKTLQPGAHDAVDARVELDDVARPATARDHHAHAFQRRTVRVAHAELERLRA